MTEHLEKIQNLTQQYTQYSRTRAGLGYVVAAVLLVVVHFFARALPLSFVGAILGGLLCLVATSTWLMLRPMVSSQLYQGFGVAKAPTPLFNKDFLLGSVFGAILGTGLVFLLRSSGIAQFPNTYIWAAPAFIVGGIAAWGEFKRNGKMQGLVVFLFGGAIGGGINANADNLTEIQRTIQLVALVFTPLLLVFMGVRQHLEFRRLEQAFKDLGKGQP